MIRPDAGSWAVGKAVDPAADVVEQTGLSDAGLLEKLSGLRELVLQ